MTPKRAVSNVNRITRNPRKFPTPAQVQAFLVADGCTKAGPFRSGTEFDYMELRKPHPTEAGEFYEFIIPVRVRFDSVRRIREICENIAIMKGDHWASVQVMDIMAKIEVN